MQKGEAYLSSDVPRLSPTCTATATPSVKPRLSMLDSSVVIEFVWQIVHAASTDYADVCTYGSSKNFTRMLPRRPSVRCILVAMQEQYLFQFCQKLVVFSADRHSVLFARRRGEADFDEYWSLIGGKLERTDGGILEGIRREKDEEVGVDFRVRVAPMFSCYNVHYLKKSGVHMILPHYVAVHEGGDVALNQEEYSDYKWVALSELDDFGPKVDNTSSVVENAQRLLPMLGENDFVTL